MDSPADRQARISEILKNIVINRGRVLIRSFFNEIRESHFSSTPEYLEKAKYV